MILVMKLKLRMMENLYYKLEVKLVPGMEYLSANMPKEE